ncbi:glycosyltransferase involved in cell wall biosynthesis [Methanohalophilus levihalophilus]|uniref:glycosyltransferase family 4 protein n=1 Tax=Methanohalophilus levihalophilus TaxID=1431282 RepID=UPI001AE167B9|nr:glycosyltransferase family 4 protein [Methanohalophilus levihalophilus]MBP2030686.1 glycosyltransferase involved in cell wall biosynthesis [Methanohalophilus levihalophilus]
MESLRIGMFSWESPHSVKVGGISPHVTELSETLAKMGHEVHIFTRKGWYRDYDEINGVHYERCGNDNSGDIIWQMDSMCGSMYDRLTSFKKKYGDFDVLHGHDWHPVKALCKIKEDHGNPFVLTYHSTEWGRNGNNEGNWWGSKEISHREWLGGYESSQVIATQEQFKKEIMNLYQIPEDKISVIPNGIYDGKMQKDVEPEEIKLQNGIDPSSPVVLFTGRMNYQKGPDMLARAIPWVLNNERDANFVFIGEGDMRGHCEQLVYEMGVQDSCHFLGYAPNDVLTDWMNTADIACVPSRNEPFGIVVLEAWDASRPVIATDAIHLIDNFSNGIVGYQTPESIGWCLNYALDGLNSSTKQMGINGKKMIKAKYCWEKIAKSTLDTYNNAMGK